MRICCAERCCVEEEWTTWLAGLPAGKRGASGVSSISNVTASGEEPLNGRLSGRNSVSGGSVAYL